MPISSTALLFASSVAKAIGNISAGNSARKEAEFAAKATLQQTGLQAQVTREQAERERQIALAEEEDFRRAQARLFAQRRAALGASGVRLDTGTPILAASDFAAETELQARRIREGGATTTSRLIQQANLTESAYRS